MSQKNGEQEGATAPGLDEEARRRTLSQMLALFARPEIERRWTQGVIPWETFSLTAFQVLWGDVSKPPLVRLNEEVQVLAELSTVAKRELKIGDPFEFDDDTKLLGIWLLEHEEAKCAHFTAVRIGSKWVFSFDFRYQKDLARAHVEAAEEFHEAAVVAQQKGHLRALVDNAHSCAELLAKVELLLIAQVLCGRVEHREVKAKAGKFLHCQDVHALLVRLAELRLPARYLVGALQLEEGEVDAVVAALKVLMERARAATLRAVPSFG